VGAPRTFWYERVEERKISDGVRKKQPGASCVRLLGVSLAHDATLRGRPVTGPAPCRRGLPSCISGVAEGVHLGVAAAAAAGAGGTWARLVAAHLPTLQREMAAHLPGRGRWAAGIACVLADIASGRAAQFVSSAEILYLLSGKIFGRMPVERGKKSGETRAGCSWLAGEGI